MKQLYKGLQNYHGKIQKDNVYYVTEEGRDWFKLLDRTYIPKFVLSRVYIEESEDDLPEWNADGIYDSRNKPRKLTEKSKSIRRDSKNIKKNSNERVSRKTNYAYRD